MRHNCPACNCHLGQYALVGYHNGDTHIEGLIEKVMRLAAELAKCRAKATR